MEDQVKKAVALRYQSDRDRAPRIVATGKGELAQHIINEARNAGIPLYEDSELAALLMKLPLDTEIPPELYRAVAEVLIFIYRLDQKAQFEK